MNYEDLLTIADEERIEVIEMNFKGNIKGLYADYHIALNKKINTTNEKKCILAEELGHHFCSTGDIIKQDTVTAIKQEKKGREWSYKRLVPIAKIINASLNGCSNKHELAEEIGVTEDFLQDALKWYQDKYGEFYEYDDYCVYFNPLIVVEYKYM